MERLYRAKKAQVRMVADRGYDIEQSDPPGESQYLTMSFPDFLRHVNELFKTTEYNIKNLLNALYTKKDDKNQRLYVYFAGLDNPNEKIQIPTTVAQAFIKSYQMKDKPQKNIFIHYETLSPNAASEIMKNIPSNSIQFMKEEFLVTNPIDHYDRSTYYLMTPEEQSTFYKSTGTNPNLVLLFKMNDPIIQYYDYQPGDLIRITRQHYNLNTPIKTTINYRVVTKN